jgi:deoxyribonuclease IV
MKYMYDSKKLNFGTAGIPSTTVMSSSSGTVDGIKEVSNLGLDCLEIEFVRNVYLKKSSEETINNIKNIAEDLNISLSIHAPYFINFNAKEDYKIRNSIRYVYDSLIVGQNINAKIVVFHPAYFLSEKREVVLEKTYNNLLSLIDTFDKKRTTNISIGLELTGKQTQVGSFEDLIFFYERLKNKYLKPVFDFSHLHARYNGFFKSKKNIKDFFIKLNSYPELLKNMHCHLSGINYSEKGERNHLMLEESDMPYIDILENLKNLKATGTIICESPIIEKDALLLKKTYSNL